MYISTPAPHPGLFYLLNGEVNGLTREYLNIKLRVVFEGVVVNKGLLLTRDVSGLPQYIAEYLITKFCSDGVKGGFWEAF